MVESDSPGLIHPTWLYAISMTTENAKRCSIQGASFVSEIIVQCSEFLYIHNINITETFDLKLMVTFKVKLV